MQELEVQNWGYLNLENEVKIEEKIIKNMEKHSKQMNAKNDRSILLDEYDKEQNREKNLSFKTLIFVLLSMLVTFSVVLPGIYIKNKIYYISRDIGKLYEQHTVLKEENRELRRKIEKIQFKNQILDSIFIQEDEQ